MFLWIRNSRSWNGGWSSQPPVHQDTSGNCEELGTGVHRSVMRGEGGVRKRALYGRRLGRTAHFCMVKPSPAVLDEIVLACPVLFMEDEDAYVLLKANQRLNTFCRKGWMSRKAAHRLNTWGLSRNLISMGNSRFYRHDQLSLSS